MEVAGIALAVVSIAVELGKVGRKIYKTSQRLPVAQNELRACYFEVNGFTRTMQMARETMERLSSDQMTRADVRNICQIMEQAEAFAQDINGFLRELRKALRANSRRKLASIRFLRDLRAVQQWEKYRPQLDIFKWSLYSQKASLHLMTDLFMLRHLGAILRGRNLSTEQRIAVEKKQSATPYLQKSFNNHTQGTVPGPGSAASSRDQSVR